MILTNLCHGNLKVCQPKKLSVPAATDNSLSPSIKLDKNVNFRIIFKGSCLKQKNGIFMPQNMIIFFIAYELDTWSRDVNSDFDLKDCLFEGS